MDTSHTYMQHTRVHAPTIHILHTHKPTTLRPHTHTHTPLRGGGDTGSSGQSYLPGHPAGRWQQVSGKGLSLVFILPPEPTSALPLHAEVMWEPPRSPGDTLPQSSRKARADASRGGGGGEGRRKGQKHRLLRPRPAVTSHSTSFTGP